MDLAEIDENGKGLQFFGKTKVERLEKVEGQPNVYLLQSTIELERPNQAVPKPGQFYLIRSAKSAVHYNRPISVYHSEEWTSNEGKKKVLVQFMILEKGRGTGELCHMTLWDDISVIGPLGTPWPLEECRDLAEKNKGQAKICIVGGGIGVAPVANLASSLPDGSYDFYAAFKSGSYGLERVHSNRLEITTDDGSCGRCGMLPCALTKEAVQAAGYELILACGPTPALVYVQKLAAELGIKCYISMEHRMLCGLGACLGCTIETTKGLKRCCKDGPVFDASEVIFDPPTPRRQPLAAGEEPDLSVDIAGVHFKNPTIASGGTFAFGQNFRGVSDVAAWGGIVSKGVTLEPRKGNHGERSLEVAGLAWGMSADTAYYCVSAVRAVTKKPLMVKLSPNAADNRPIAIACIKAGEDAISLINMIHGVAIDIDKGKPFFNNVHAGYSGPGLKPLALRIVYDVVQEINKLPPEQRVPVVGIGGICTWQDAVEFIMAGASAVEIGQAKFTNPNVAIDIQNGLRAFMKSHGYHNLSEMRGIAQVARHNKAHTDEKGRFADLHAMMK